MNAEMAWHIPHSSMRGNRMVLWRGRGLMCAMSSVPRVPLPPSIAGCSPGRTGGSGTGTGSGRSLVRVGGRQGKGGALRLPRLRLGLHRAQAVERGAGHLQVPEMWIWQESLQEGNEEVRAYRSFTCTAVCTSVRPRSRSGPLPRTRGSAQRL